MTWPKATMKTVAEVDEFFGNEKYRCRRTIVRAARRAGFKGSDVDEVVNDVYLACRDQVSRNGGINESVAAWVSRVTRNIVIDYNLRPTMEMRHYERRARVRTDVAACPGEVLEGDENCNLVKLAVHALPLEDQIGLKRAFSGTKLKELSRDTGHPIWRISRWGKSAIIKLRGFFESPSHVMSMLVREGPMPDPVAIQRIAEAHWGKVRDLWACVWQLDHAHIQVLLYRDPKRCACLILKAVHPPDWSLTSQCMWQVTTAISEHVPAAPDMLQAIRIIHVAVMPRRRLNPLNIPYPREFGYSAPCHEPAVIPESSSYGGWIGIHHRAGKIYLNDECIGDVPPDEFWRIDEAVVTTMVLGSPQAMLEVDVLRDAVYGLRSLSRCGLRRERWGESVYTVRPKLPGEPGTIIGSAPLEDPEDEWPQRGSPHRDTTNSVPKTLSRS